MRLDEPTTFLVSMSFSMKNLRQAFEAFIKFSVISFVVLFPFVVVALVMAGPLAVFLVAGHALVLGLCQPWVLVALSLLTYLAFSSVMTWLAVERELVRQVGPKQALWASWTGDAGLWLLAGPRIVAQHVVVSGWDLSGPWLSDKASLLGVPSSFVDSWAREGLLVAASLLWSSFVNAPLLGTLLWLAFHAAVVWPFFFSRIYIRNAAKLAGFVLKYTPFVYFVLYSVPARFYLSGLYVVLKGLALLPRTNREGVSLFLTWVSWRFTALVVDAVALVEAVNWELKLHTSNQFASGSGKFMAHFRQFSLRSMKFISDLQLPEFVRRRMRNHPTLRELEDSNALMASLGWPINVGIAEPVINESTLPFSEWIMCGTDFRQGIHNLKCHVDESLDSLRIAGVAYRRSEEYATEKNEIEATSRYFRSPRFDYPDLDINDVWFLVADIFRNSRFTSFNYIIAAWEKKYALGAFMRRPGSSRSKYSRRDFISFVGGYAPFKRMWAATFYYAAALVPVSAVSVKNETLPMKKWANDKVRTVIGTPLGHYIMSTFFNYGPNHTFAWETTPIKVGMPLNGWWMSWLFSRHSRCQIHVEGDFTAFDSTIDGPVLDVVRAIRKKGYELHKDRNKIAALIDATYDQVTFQLLNTTSNGNVYYKGAGMTTGHSSTSMDNSLALVTLYMMAWKQLTGLTAREFVFFNELSCYGDDHLLSILQTRPPSWSPTNIARVMSKWGVVNNVEVKRLQDCEFLSKKTRRATTADIMHMSANGVSGVSQIVWHNKTKLVGKLTAPIKSRDVNYKLKRLLSYLTLTAHHEDIHEGIVKVVRSSRAMMAIVKNEKVKIPSYATVLKQWYSPSMSPPVGADFDGVDFNDGRMAQVGAVSLLDQFLGTVSALPDLLNPAIFNFGYQRLLQARLKPRLQWAVDFLALQNSSMALGAIRGVLQRTPYRFLEASEFLIGQSGANKSEMLLRHWLFLAYMHIRPTSRTLPMLAFVANRFSSLQFLINGILMSEGRTNDWSVDLVVVVSLLSLVHIPDWFGILSSVVLPDLNAFIEMFTHFVFVGIWTSVPANYRDVSPALASAKNAKGGLLLEAPTGTGKSTGLVAYLANAHGHHYRKIIVIEPRHVLVVGLTRYMQADYGLHATAGTSGEAYDPTAKVVYATPQWLLGHLEMIASKQNLVVVDEAHIPEEFVMAFIQILKSLRREWVAVTATPVPSLQEACAISVSLNTPSLWHVNMLEERAKHGESLHEMHASYTQFLVAHMNALGPSERALGFVRTPEEAERIAARIRRPVVCLSSKHAVPRDWDGQVYLATTVADVGLTIPGLTKVITPDFVQIDDLYALPPEFLKQRRGRVGRTNNGTCIVWKRQGVPLPALSKTLHDVKTMKTLMFSGFPVELAMKFSPASASEALGFSYDSLPVDDINAVTRAASVFLRNLVPVSTRLASAGVNADASLGDPAVLFETGAGGISSTFVSSAEDFEERVSESLPKLVSAILSHSTEALPTSWDSVAGPVVAVKNLVSALLHDPAEGQTSLLNPKNREPTGTLESVYETSAIMNILNALD